MLLFIPRSLCALKRVAAKSEHSKFGATQGIRIALASGLYRAEATDGHRAMVVQGLVPIEDPPWPGFKDLPDDACEAIVLPKDLERACKVGENFLQSRFNMLGIATMGNDLCLGLGSELVTARTFGWHFGPLDSALRWAYDLLLGLPGLLGGLRFLAVGILRRTKPRKRRPQRARRTIGTRRQTAAHSRLKPGLRPADAVRLRKINNDIE